MKDLLIGKSVEIKNSKNLSLVGLKGLIVDETQYTLVIECDGQQKNVLKKACEFIINDVVVKGEILQKRPHERLKNGK